MSLEVCNNILSLDLLSGNDPLVILLESLVLVLILAGEHLILGEDYLSAALLLVKYGIRLEDENLILQLQVDLLLMRVLELLQDLLEVELVELLDFPLVVEVWVRIDRLELGQELTGLDLGCLSRRSSGLTSRGRIGLFRRVLSNSDGLMPIAGVYGRGPGGMCGL